MHALGLSPQFEAIPTIFRPPPRALLTSTCPTQSCTPTGPSWPHIASLAEIRLSSGEITIWWGQLRCQCDQGEISRVVLLMLCTHMTSVKGKVSLHVIEPLDSYILRKLCSEMMVKYVWQLLSPPVTLQPPAYCHARSTHTHGWDGGNKRTVASFLLNE